ncbi:ROK family protein [Gymnodinialimonas sp. 2307UL20-7]
MDLCGALIAFREVAISPSDQTPEAVISVMENQVTEVIHGRGDVAGLAVSVPGVVTDTGVVLRAPTLEWRDVPLTARLQVRFPDITLQHVSNDASLYAAAFSFRFPDRLGRNAIVAWLDTGIGGGLVANGSVIAGNSGLAGEIGHMVRPGNRADDIQRLEDIAGSWALLSRNAELGGNARTLKELLDEHRAGLPPARRSLREWSDVIAETLTNMASLVDPGVMLFSGPMASVLQHLEADTFASYKAMLQYGTPPAQWRIEISNEHTLVRAGAVLLRHDFLSYNEAQSGRTGARGQTEASVLGGGVSGN